MKKKLILSIGTLGALFVIAPVISCASSQTKQNIHDSMIAQTKEVSWSDKVSNIPVVKKYTWDANNSKTVDQLVDQMNGEMNLYLPKTITTLSPYDFANFTLNFFLNNGGGNIMINTEYKNESENITLQLQRPLLDMIESFDGSPVITSSTTRYNGTVSNGLINIAIKLASSSSPMEALTKFWDLFGDYGKEIFGTDSVFQLLETMNTNPMLIAFVGLIEPFPASTLSALPIFFGLFKTMAQEINTSAIDIKWAADNGVTEQLQNIDKIILDKLLHSVNPE